MISNSWCIRVAIKEEMHAQCTSFSEYDDGTPHMSIITPCSSIPRWIWGKNIRVINYSNDWLDRPNCMSIFFIVKEDVKSGRHRARYKCVWMRATWIMWFGCCESLITITQSRPVAIGAMIVYNQKSQQRPTNRRSLGHVICMLCHIFK